MGIRKSKITPSINVDDMLKKVEISHETETEKLDVDKRLKEILENHRSEQTKMLTEHESNIRKILKRNEGIWFSDFWMKVLVIFLFVYTIVLGLVVYCVT